MRRALRAMRRWATSGRLAGLTVVGAGYSLVLAGAAIGGMNFDRVARVGLVVLYGGAVLLATGCLLLVRVWWRRRRWAARTAGGEIERFGGVAGVGNLPRPGDVDLVISLATEHIEPELFYDSLLLHEYIRRNPGALRCLRGDAAHPTVLTGYYILLALSKRGEGLIRDGAIDVGVALPPRLTVENPADGAALYIGMVQGFGKVGKAHAVAALIEHIHQIAQENGRKLRVYARNGNDSSRRLMSNLLFTPVIGDGNTTIEVATAPSPESVKELVRRYAEISVVIDGAELIPRFAGDLTLPPALPPGTSRPKRQRPKAARAQAN